MQGESRKECLRTLCVYMRAACAGDWQFGDTKTVQLWPHGWAATYRIKFKEQKEFRTELKPMLLLH